MNTKRIIGLVFRACGLVAIVIGVVLILQWIRIETNGPVNSGPHRLFGCISVVSGLFGIVCRITEC